MKKTLQLRITESVAKHPDWDERRMASAIRGATREMIRAVREGKPWTFLEVEDPRCNPAEGAGTISLDQVRKRYDIAAAIRAELEALKPGALILERELCLRTAGRDAARFRRTIENAEDLRAFRVKLKLDPEQPEGAFYWGRRQDVAEALKLRDE